MEKLIEGRERILSLYGKTEKDMSEYITILREWMKKEPHLPSDLLEDKMLELYLIKTKFSLEKTKDKIENYCSLKSSARYGYLFTKPPSDLTSKRPQNYVIIPQLTEENRRILIGKVWNEKEYDFHMDVLSVIYMREVLIRCDYNDGEILILDYSDCTPMVISKLRVNLLVDVIYFLLKGLAARIKEVHIVFKSVNALVNFVKPVLPNKLASRIHSHEDISTLKNFIPAKYLPKEYGGEQKSLHELKVEIIDSMITKHQEEINGYFSLKSREELRVGATSEDMKGTFRKLNID